jgi:hypothetical protein
MALVDNSDNLFQEVIKIQKMISALQTSLGNEFTLELGEIRASNTELKDLTFLIKDSFQTIQLSLGGISVTLGTIQSQVQQILSAMTPPVVSAISFGWNGNMTTYQLPSDPTEVINVTAFEFSDADTATLTLSVVDEDGNAFTPTTPPTYTQDVTTFGSLAVAADGMSAVATPTADAGVGVTNVTIQVTNDDGTPAAALATSFTTEMSDAGTLTATWADNGPTVVAAPPVTPPATS